MTRPEVAQPLHTPSLRRRVTLTVLALVALMLIVLTVATDVVLGNRLEAQMRQRLVDRIAVASALVDTVESEDLVRRLEGDGVSVRLRDSDGRLYTAGPLRPGLSSADRLDTPPGNADRGPGGPKKPTTDAIVQSGDLLSVSDELADGSTLTVLANVGDVRRTLSQVRLALLLAAAVVLGLAGLVVGPVVARVLRPLDHITGVARSIGSGDRGRRLRPDRPETELGRTAAAFDNMLDAVEGAERQAIDSEQRLRTFLADVAHELRTPLTGIRAAAEYLIRSNPDRADREKTMVTLVREAQRAGRLVEDMLLMGHIDRGLELRMSDFDLGETVATVLDSRRLTNPNAVLDDVGGTVLVLADRDRIIQVIGNLIDNALHATGGSGTIVVTVSQNDGTAVLDVTDDGPGIPNADRERIFERLVRIDAARTNHQGGAGLGLPIARGIARAHHGDLNALEPTLGKGAQFRLTLPANSNRS